MSNFIFPPVAPGISRFSHFSLVAPIWMLSRLRGAAYLYGISAPKPETAQILELGCGNGKLSLLLAQQYPEAELVGICGTQEEWRLATEACRVAQVSNARFLVLDQPDALRALGDFDYVLVRNQYGMQPHEGRLALAQFVSSVLKPGGLACMDYPVYPGAKAFEVVRDGVLMALADVPDENLESTAKASLAMFSEGAANGMLLEPALRHAASSLRTHIEQVGLKNALAVEETPCYFVEFAGVLAEAGLVSVGDAEPWNDLGQAYGNQAALVNQTLALGQPALMRMQYLDFSAGRSRRHTLLVHADGKTSMRSPDLARLRELRWASAFQRRENGESLDGAVIYEDQQGRALTAIRPMMIAMLDLLSFQWPASLSFDALANDPAIQAARTEQSEDGRAELQACLEQCFLHDVLHFSSGAGPYDVWNEKPPAMLPSFSRALCSPQDTTEPGHLAVEVHNLFGDKVRSQWSAEAHHMVRVLVERGLTVQSLLRSEVDGSDPSVVLEKEPFSKGESAGGQVSMKVLAHLLRLGILRIDAPELHGWLQQVLMAPGNRGNGWVLFLGSVIAQGHDQDKEKGIKTAEEDVSWKPQVVSSVKRSKELLEQGAYQQSRQQAENLLRRYPDLIPARYVLVKSLQKLGLLKEALQHLPILLDAGGKDNADIWQLTADVLLAGELYPGALVAARRAGALRPGSAEAASVTASVYVKMFSYGAAVLHHHRMLEYAPDSPAARVGLANALSEFGAPDEAVEAMQPCLEQYGDELGIYAPLLYALNYSSEKTAEEIFEYYRKFDNAALRLYRAEWKPHRNRKRWNRKLKIAYVSADLWQHAVSRFVEPVFQHHDREAFEITAYANQAKEDDFTRRFKGYVDHWVPIVGMNNTEFVDRIRGDEIDILIDLSGHTAGNRLRAFACKPAPVSVSWLGYVYTTGLSAIDYFLTDEEMAPAGSEHLFAERPWRLPGSNYVFRPDWPALGEVNTLPALDAGVITFGSLTRSLRVNQTVVKTWARILSAVPNSRLVVNSKSYYSAESQNLLKQKFLNEGVEPERILSGYNSPPWDILRTVDIALDCFPHNSGTTLFDGLCMGVPYITLAGRPSVGRLGASILRGLGRPEWIAHNQDEYVEKVLALASDLPTLANIRAGLRSELRASELLDEVGFTRKLEEAYREMFRIWCEQGEQ